MTVLRVWSPDAERVDLVLGEERRPMQAGDLELAPPGPRAVRRPDPRAASAPNAG